MIQKREKTKAKNRKPQKTEKELNKYKFSLNVCNNKVLAFDRCLKVVAETKKKLVRSMSII